MKTASEVREEQFMQQRAFSMLQGNSDFQAESIAKHYLAHAMVCQQILKLLDHKRIAHTSEVDALIEYNVNLIKANHRNDLGIELEWKKVEPDWIDQVNRSQ